MTLSRPRPPPPRPTDPALAGLSFDDAFAQLKTAVAELEAGGLSLEDTIARTERAVALQRHCERLLGEAELRVSSSSTGPAAGSRPATSPIDEASEG